MGSLLKRCAGRLRLVAALSTFWAALFCGPLAGGGADAHEVLPTIADLRHADGRLTLEMRLNVEAFLAGINLDGVTDTNMTAQAADYDRLRNLFPTSLEPLIRDLAGAGLPGMQILAPGPLPLRLDNIRIEDDMDVSLPRTTILQFSAALPPRTSSLSVTWPEGAGALVLRQHGVDAPYTGLLNGGDSSGPIDLGGGDALTGWQTFRAYIPVGFDHILPKGLDHILFVLALYFLSTRLSALVWQISAFTLAHTVTLALGALGWVQVPASVVEPLIAASIAFVAVENLLSDRLNRWRPMVIFGFGLLHGLGFASVLGEFGLPADRFIPALIGFNIGVELGQLTVIAGAFLAVGLWFGSQPWYRARVAVPASGAIALIGVYWLIERLFL